MIESVVVILIVAAVIGFSAWRFYRVATGKDKSPCCGCSGGLCDQSGRVTGQTPPQVGGANEPPAPKPDGKG